MEKDRKNHSKVLVKAGLIVAGALALAACGQVDPPTPQEFNNGVRIVTLDNVVAANGEPVKCAFYGAEGDYKSWFSFDCDYEGTAVFPGEIAVTTTTQG